MHAARPTWTGLLACALALASCGPDAAPEPAEDPTASHGAPPVAQGPTPAPPPIDEPGPEPPPPPSSGAGDTLQEIFAIAEASREGPDAAAGFQAARARLQEVLDHHPDDPALHAAMGHLWVDELRWRRLEGAEREMHRGHAEQAYQRALVLDPDHVRANAGLGDLLLGLDTAAGAEASLPYYERALAGDPGDPHARQRLADARARAAQPDTSFWPSAEGEGAPPPPDDGLGPADPEPLEPGPTSPAGELVAEAPEVDPEPDPHLEAWKAFAEREADDPSVQRATAIQCRERGDMDCARAHTARAAALEADDGGGTP